ncbi:uncharacterized protein LOC133843423 isoform X1 [Drosophila sulfurigaster albostrigata]|uniref:uncharacterized protein LOC133843423 isoform X1 n=1 Tax=Drosophila sulfurigaster albostrigata TaxID=89887 RepID=UPI002D219E5D|nr:uncharacterized protein LOC133843423 isoform X1 [Drosophila sulfurigaster albostrigata]
MNIDRLISEVEQRPALWDATHPEHADQGAIRREWLGVAEAMNANVGLCRRKWQSLRRSYLRCVSLRIPWIHAEAMRFLGNGNDENDEEIDDNYFFVISLLTTMRRMTPLLNIEFRTMVMDGLRCMMTKMQQEQQEPSSTTL